MGLRDFINIFSLVFYPKNESSPNKFFQIVTNKLRFNFHGEGVLILLSPCLTHSLSADSFYSMQSKNWTPCFMKLERKSNRVNYCRKRLKPSYSARNCLSRNGKKVSKLMWNRKRLICFKKHITIAITLLVNALTHFPRSRR